MRAVHGTYSSIPRTSIAWFHFYNADQPIYAPAFLQYQQLPVSVARWPMVEGTETLKCRAAAYLPCMAGPGKRQVKSTPAGDIDEEWSMQRTAFLCLMISNLFCSLG